MRHGSDKRATQGVERERVLNKAETDRIVGLEPEKVFVPRRTTYTT